MFNLSFTDDVDEDDEEESEKFAQNTQQKRRRELSKEKIERGRRNAKNFDRAWIGEYIATKANFYYFTCLRVFRDRSRRWTASRRPARPTSKSNTERLINIYSNIKNYH